jgi:4-amino-4-deoxy-L-arabinose transferase-like glycosyltransferase
LIPAWAVVGWGAIALRRRGVMGLALVAGLYYAGQHLYSPVLNIVSFVLVVCLALAMLRVRAGLSLRRLGVGVLLVILLAAPWFVAVYQQAPQETSKRLFGYKHAINLGETMEAFTGPPYYILLIVGVGALPWAPAALAGLARAFRRREADETAIIVAGAWIGILLFYTLSEAQMGHFYGVLQPSLACLAAVGLCGLTRSRPRAAMPVVLVAVVLWLVVRVEPSVLLETANVFSRLHQAVEPLAWVSGSMLAWLVLVVLSCLLRHRMLAVASVLPALVLVVYLTQGLVPELERFKTTRLMWDAYVELRHPGEPIGAAAQALHTSFYYSNNSIVRLKQTEQVEAFLRGPGDKFIILPRDVFLSSFDRFLAPGARWEPIVDSHPRHILVRYTLDQGPSPPGPTPVTR